MMTFEDTVGSFVVMILSLKCEEAADSNNINFYIFFTYKILNGKELS